MSCTVSMSKRTIGELYLMQYRLEDIAIGIGKDKYNHTRNKAIARHDVSRLPPEKRLISESIGDLSNFMRWHLMRHGHGPAEYQKTRTILKKIDTDQTAFITLQAALNLSTRKPAKFATVANGLGEKIMKQIEYVNSKRPSPVQGIQVEPLATGQAHRVGAWCLGRLLESVGKDLFELKAVRKSKNKMENHFIIKPSALEWLEKAHAGCSLLTPQYLPMIVPPVNWRSTHSGITGGFLSQAGPYRQPAVHCKYGHSPNKSISNESIYECLNALQATPYRINKSVLEVMQQRQPDHTLRLHWQLWLADKFKELSAIYFCWFADWRGRVYPIQQYINPQADGNGKALLEFSKGKALGKHGERWLAIHGANTFGIDKCTFAERLRWIEEHQELILDSARNPLNGSCFWSKADKPFMFLAFCFEWLGYIEQGESFISHLPVSMDGSCSGLQHYSALLLDEAGGMHVNLVPMDRPADIYGKVAEESQRIAGNEWDGKIDRSLTKRNTMTFTYSATLHGFTNQNLEEMRKRDPQQNRKAALDLAKVNLEAIRKTVVKAAEAMEYLKDVSKAFVRAEKSFSWVTPSGFKVNHKYTKCETRIITTCFGSIRTRTTLAHYPDTATIDARKSIAGIAPNFIHSLDASHLALTVKACLKAGITDFMMIHDSFGCHAADTTAMNRILREEFIKMYSDNFLQDFHEQVKRQLPGKFVGKLPNPPGQGRLELESVRESEYFFA